MATIIRRRRLGLTSCKGITEASQSGITFIRNDAELPKDDVYIRWGCTSNVPAETVINASKGIHRVANKRDFRLALDEEGLCPKTWGSATAALRERKPSKDQPLIVRRATHAQGRNLHVATTAAELKRYAGKYESYYVSEFIDKVEEFRVFVMQGKVVWVAQKTPANPEDVAWNVAKGGRFDNVKWGGWKAEVVDVAIKAWRLSGLHFGGVDVMVDGTGKATVLEVNSAPSQTSPYRQQCVAKAFDWMVELGEYALEPFEDVDKKYNWKNVIHPAVRGEERE